MVNKCSRFHTCTLCGTVVEVLEAQGFDLVCCGRPMVSPQVRTAGIGKARHVPIIEAVPGGVKVVVGADPHPTDAAHFIKWIEVLSYGQRHRQYLRPGQPPEAVFAVSAENVVARVYCCVHGLWRSRRPSDSLIGQRKTGRASAMSCA
jgi:superoxide reductase